MSSRLGIAGIVLLAAFGLAACGGGGGTTASTDGDDDTAMEQTPQQMCEAANGRWNDDGTCTSATDLAAEVAAATKAALTKETAIATEAAQTEAGGTGDAGLGGSAVTATGNDAGAYNLAISRDRSGTTVTVTVEGATDAADEDFVGDQPGQMLTRTMEATETTDAMTEVAVVHTDIEAPKATLFAMVDGQVLNARDLDATEDGTDMDGDTTNDFTALDFDSTSADVRALVMSPSFVPGAGRQTVLSFANDDTSTTEMDEAAEVAGTYNGAPGTYRCNGGSPCGVTLDAMGMITAMSDDWVFTPDPGATSDVPDADYLHYGFWLKKTTADGAVTYNEVETFAGSSIDASTGSEIDDVEGTATYEGGAAGVYVHKTFATDGTSEATSGHFTADVDLTVYFGGGGIPADKHNTLVGTIDNFMLSGEEENSWSVALEGTRATGENTISGTAGGATGSFSGTFHGPTALTEDTEDSATNRDMPHTVVGEFNSVFSNGSVAGGFGARKAE